MVWDPEGYGAMVREEVPDFDRLQDEVALATADVAARRILELGTGTAITTRRVLERHPEAQLVGIDSSPEMLAQPAASCRAPICACRTCATRCPRARSTSSSPRSPFTTSTGRARPTCSSASPPCWRRTGASCSPT